MKALLIELGATDKRALEFVRDSLSVCAHDHILSRKLLIRFSTMNGSMIAITPPWIDLDQLKSYEWGWKKAPEGYRYEDGYYPRDLLVAFVQDYLRANANRIVVSENWALPREHITLQPWPPPRLACYGDNEVFHLLTPDITDKDQIEAAVVSRHHWQTGICTECARVPEADIPDEAFLDEIVQNTAQIFIPAFDGSGYLIWKK